MNIVMISTHLYIKLLWILVSY